MGIKKRLLKNTFFSSINIYTEYALGLIGSIIIARSLGPDDYGVYSLLIWLSASSIILINGGINTGQIKFLSELQKTHGFDHASNTLKYFKKIQTIKTILIVIVAILIKPYILSAFQLDNYSLYYWLIIAALILRGRHMFNISTMKGFQQFDKLAKVTLIVTPINLMLIVLAAIYYKNIEYFIYIYLFTSFLFYFISKYFSKINETIIKQEIDPDFLNRVNNYLKITSVIVILGYFVSKELELFMLGWLASPKDAGMFRIAMTLSTSILLMLPGVFSSILLPVMSSSLAESKNIAKRMYYESTRILIILCIPLATFICITSPHLVVAVYGEAYQPASLVLSICIIAVAIMSIADSSQSYLLSADKQKLLLYILLISLVVKLSIGYVLISKFGLLGAALTYLISIIVAFTPRIYLACKYLDSKFPFLTLVKCLFVSLISSIPSIYIIDTSNHYSYLAYSALIFSILFICLSFISKIWAERDFETFIILSEKVPVKYLRNKTQLLIKSLKEQLYPYK